MDDERILKRLLWLAVAVGAALRLIALGHKSLWLDEVVTLRIASSSVSAIINHPWDPHPPLYYLLMHYWVRLGQSECILRLPSALAGVAAIPLLYGLVRVWGGRASAVASAWLLAAAPLHIWYSQETRMYALVCALGLASSLCYSLAIRHGHLLAWAFWSAATAVGLYTDYSMLLLLAAQWILLGPAWRAFSRRRATLGYALAASAVVLLVFAPQAVVFAQQVVLRGGQVGYYRIVQVWLLRASVDVSEAQLHAAAMTAGGVALISAVVAAYTLFGRLRRVRANLGLVLAAMGAYLVILALSAAPRGLSLKRQALILFPYGLSAIAVCIALRRWGVYFLLALLLATLPLSGYVALAQEQEAWRDVAGFIGPRAGPEDIILFDASYMREPFEYYYHGVVPRQGVGPASVPENLAAIAAAHRRVWLVLSQDALSDPQGTVQHWLDENGALVGEYIFEGVRVRLYETTGG